MTKGEYEARLKVIKYLVWVRKSYEQLHGGISDKKSVLRGFNIEQYVPVAEIEQQTNVKTSLIRLALKDCNIVVGKTGKAGGYRLNVAPKELNGKALSIKTKNNRVNPLKWVRVVPLTVNDVIGKYVDSLLSKELFGIENVESILKLLHNELEKQVLYLYPIHLF